MFSIVATETSLMTFIIIPGIGFSQDNLYILQLVVGYIIGRVLSSYILLPSYYNSNFISIYELIGKSFGISVQKLSSVIFLFTRLLADGIRFLVTAYIIAEIVSLPFVYCIFIVGIITMIYSSLGGVKAIINIDTIQFFIYIVGGISVIIFILFFSNAYDGSISSVFSDFFNKDFLKLSMAPITSESYNIGSYNTSDGYYIINALFGGVLMSFCSHGIDYMMVQRALCAKNLKSAQKAMIGSGIIVFIQFILFLFIGHLLIDLYDPNEDSNKVFSKFIIEEMPIGIKGLLVAGVLSAAMSTLSSSINSLSSSTIIDLKIKSNHRNKTYLAIFWCLVLMLFALFFPYDKESSLYDTVLGIVSFTYGPLLSLFILAKFKKKFSSFSVFLGVLSGILSVMISYSNGVAFTLFILIGFSVNIVVVFLINAIEKK